MTRTPDTGDQTFVAAWLQQETRERHYAQAIARVSSMPFDAIVSQGQWVPRSLLRADLEAFSGNASPARADYDAARQTLERELQKRPDDARLHSSVGRAYAGIGLKSEGMKGIELYGPSRDAMIGPGRVLDLARIYTAIGNYGAAVEQLDMLLSSKGRLTLRSIETDPGFDALRNTPEYRRLADKYR